MQIHRVSYLHVVMFLALCAPIMLAQTRTEPGQTTTRGVVTSSARDSLIVRSDSGSFDIFMYDRYTVKPPNISTGSEVTVVSRTSADTRVRLALAVTVTRAGTGSSPALDEPVPDSVRRVERDIKRQARRYGFGVRAGAGLDPELLVIGIQGRVGPFFSDSFSLRPSLEYGFGEVTKLFAFNVDGIYRLPFSPREGNWTAYVGAGPSFGFGHESFQRNAGVDFGDFKYQGGLNILTGVEFRNGVFMEAKTTVYASPHLRLVFGYNF
jgi:hypothetical protein